MRTVEQMFFDNSRIMELPHKGGLLRRLQRDEFLAVLGLRRGVELSQSAEIPIAVLLRVDVLEHEVDESGHSHVYGARGVRAWNHDLGHCGYDGHLSSAEDRGLTSGRRRDR